ncbi:MAG: hypothetical protein ACRDUA_18270, partial [Micromonosporaceae bacterium]
MPADGGEATTAFSQQLLGLIGPPTPPQGTSADGGRREDADAGPHSAAYGADADHDQQASSESADGSWGFEAFASHGQRPDAPGLHHQRNGGRVPGDLPAEYRPAATGQQPSTQQPSSQQPSSQQAAGHPAPGGQSGGQGRQGGTGVEAGAGSRPATHDWSGGEQPAPPPASPASPVGSPNNDFAWYNNAPPSGDYREPVEQEPASGDYARRTRREPAGMRSHVVALIDSIVGQPALVTALREAVAAPEQDLRLLVAGPPGTGEGLTIDVLSRLLSARGFDGTAITIRYDHLARLDPTTAVGQVREWIDGCLGERLVAIEDLDQIISDGARGAALAEELHRLISICGPDLQVVAFTGVDGYRRLVDVNPAFAAWWRVVRTRDFDAGDYSTIFGRVVEQRGAVTTEDAARRAGDMLAATPAEGQLRNARLATYLAEMAIDAARRRTDGSSQPMVDLSDL